MADEEEDTPQVSAESFTGQPFVASQSLAKIAPAMLAAQKRLKNPEKNSVNPHFHNRYADLGASMDSAKAAYNAEDIAITQVFAPSSYGTVAVTTLLLHKSGEYIGGTISIPLDRDNAQGSGSAATYARRYGLQAITGMVAEDDDDGEAASVKPREPRKSTSGDGKRGLFGR